MNNTIHYVYFDEETEISFVCKIYYEPEEKGSRDSYGNLNEPDYPEVCYIEHMYMITDPLMRDISPLIQEGILDHICEKAMEDLNNRDY